MISLSQVNPLPLVFTWLSPTIIGQTFGAAPYCPFFIYPNFALASTSNKLVMI